MTIIFDIQIQSFQVRIGDLIILESLKAPGLFLHTSLGLKTYDNGDMVSSKTLLPTAREGNVSTGACLSTIGLMATQSLLILVTARSVCVLLKCFLVAIKKPSSNQCSGA